MSAVADQGHAVDRRRTVWLAAPLLPPWPVVWLAAGDRAGRSGPEHAGRAWALALDDGTGEPRIETFAADPEGTDDRGAWEQFVVRAGELLDRHPHARWVHGSRPTRTRLLADAARHGAPAGFLQRIEEALFDLLARGVGPSLGLPPGADSIRAVAGRLGLSPISMDAPTGELLEMRAVWRWLLREGPRTHCG